jgi:hypothetical protein
MYIQSKGRKQDDSHPDGQSLCIASLIELSNANESDLCLYATRFQFRLLWERRSSCFRSLLPSEFLHNTRQKSRPFPFHCFSCQFTVNDSLSSLRMNNLQYKQSWLITYDPKYVMNDFRVFEHWDCGFQRACISVYLRGRGLGDELISHQRSLKKR